MNVNYLHIGTTGIEASIAFYTTVLGFRVDQRIRPRVGMDMAFLVDGAGHQLQLVQGGQGKPYRGDGIALGFTVADIEAVSELLKRHKVRIISDAMTMPTGVKILKARDPNGLELQFVQLAPGEL